MNSIGIITLAVLLLVVAAAPRKWAVLGMMGGVLYLTLGQHIIVFGFNMFAMRFLEIAGIIRVLLKREFVFSKLNRIDTALLLLYSYTTMIFMLRSSEGQAYQIGLAVDALLCYFTFRGLIRDIEEFRWVLRTFVFLLVPYAMIVSIEMLTGQNPFKIIGGKDVIFFREGRPRCMGSFGHPALLGTLGACFLPLYLGLGFKKLDRARSVIGIFLCLAIVWLSNAGGALSSAVAGVLGWFLWVMRTRMLWLRRALLGLVLLFAIVMEAPLWYLPAKLSSITGGDGWHRSYLIDVALKNLDSWWLAGMPIKATADWFPYVIEITGGADITNQYIRFGLSAGLMAIILFIFLLIQAFRGIGKSLKEVRSGLVVAPDGTESLLWGLGVSLLVHVVSWFGVIYFDQLYVVWFMHIAIISNISVSWVMPPEVHMSKSKNYRSPLREYTKTLP